MTDTLTDTVIDAPSSVAPPPPPQQEAPPHQPDERPDGSATARRPGLVARLLPWSRLLVVLDVLIVVVLFLAALPVRWEATRGDLWMDEASYALASVRGWEANRWDRPSPESADPLQLVRLRHWHPPLTVQLMHLATSLRGSTSEQTLRAPSVIVGGLIVVLVYLCGLSLFRRPHSPGAGALVTRWAALVCACIVLFTPGQIRAASHALPWALITLWLLTLLWTLLKYEETGRARWLTLTGGALGGMFATSEYLLPTFVAVACAAPWVFWRDLTGSRGDDASSRTAPWRRIVVALLTGGALFLAVGWALWPAGLTGGALRMLGHYMAMADDVWPVEVDGRMYDHAPKWAYLFWYARDYGPYLAFYAAGVAAALVLLARRRLPVHVGALLAFSAVIVAVAHASHIIGPEYLAHALPLLTLVGGLFLILAAGAERRWLAVPALVGLTFASALVVTHQPAEPLSGMEPGAQQARWPHAARFLAGRWRSGDQMLAPQYAVVGRWYLLYSPDGHAGIREWQIEGLPERNAGKHILDKLYAGRYRFIAVGNSFMDWTPVDNNIRGALKSWRVVWRSGENGVRPSRLVLYERPPVRPPWRDPTVRRAVREVLSLMHPGVVKPFLAAPPARPMAPALPPAPQRPAAPPRSAAQQRPQRPGAPTGPRVRRPARRLRGGAPSSGPRRRPPAGYRRRKGTPALRRRAGLRRRPAVYGKRHVPRRRAGPRVR